MKLKHVSNRVRLLFCAPELSSLGLEIPEIRELDARRQSIHDLSGIQTLKGLRKLHLGHNHIVDISPLEPLSNLTGLFLNHNQLEAVIAYTSSTINSQ